MQYMYMYSTSVHCQFHHRLGCIGTGAGVSVDTIILIAKYCVQITNVLEPSEEEAVEMILTRLRRTVRQRQLLLYPYFRDFDRVRMSIL